MPTHKTLCLNMIVKNESHIIRGTLEMLCSKIRFDYWVICDTGSTDATREIIINFFAEKNIKGELHCDEWVNFAHNRTNALEYAFNKTDFLLVFDADDELHGTIRIPEIVTHDEYHLKFGMPKSGMNYTRTLLINNRKRFKYFSVLHEFISCQEPSPNEQNRTCVLEGDYYLISGRSGSRNLDPNKYLKDAMILEKAHAEALAQGDDLHKRYAFYCANSYRDCGRHEDAIRWYKITLAQDNWAQEKYVACLYANQCCEALNQKEHGFYYLVKAFTYDPARVECFYPLLMHYCCEGMNELAYNYYRMVKMPIIPNNENKLFVETDKAGFFVPYYMIIVADRVGDRECGIRMYETIFTQKHRTFSVWHLKNMMFNLHFFIKHVKAEALDAFMKLANDYMKFLIDNGVPADTFDDMTHVLNSQPKFKMPHSVQKLKCKNSRNILFYTGYGNLNWNYSHMKRGALGGSEKAVAYLSKELGMLLGTEEGGPYTIYVSGNVQAEELSEYNLKYVGLAELPALLSKTEFHTVICSRYISFLEIYGAACSFYQFYIWAHDTRLLAYGCDLRDITILERWSDHIDGCVCQTRWHADQYANVYPTLKSKISIINNGIDLALFPQPHEQSHKQRQSNKFIYTSRTERGLAHILKLWPQIMSVLPDATLAISTYEVFPCNDDERIIQARIEYLNQAFPSEDDAKPRIQHLGQLNPARLYLEMSTAEYWYYPTDWPETSCITAMEMLMSEVICLYYPVAGLTNTMGECGVKIFPGTDIHELMRITSNEGAKEALRKQGRAYAESCSWANRAQAWKRITHRTRVAIFNSFSMHYEMFGYILNYFVNATKNKQFCCKMSIFTETENNMGWLEFYKNHFGASSSGFEFEFKPVAEFSDANVRDQFDIIFIPTDDDYAFKQEWIDERCIAIEHHKSVRRPEYVHRIGTRPFVASDKQWALPCYEIVSPNEKITATLEPGCIHVALIGRLKDTINYEIINRLLVNPNVKLQLHCAGRKVTIDVTKLNANSNMSLVIHECIDTREMIELLKKCDYVLTDFQNDDHINGISMSGVVPLSFSTLTPLIISNQNNHIYKFKNVVEFELNSADRIVLVKKEADDIARLNVERDELIAMFDHVMDAIWPY